MRSSWVHREHTIEGLGPARVKKWLAMDDKLNISVNNVMRLRFKAPLGRPSKVYTVPSALHLPAGYQD